jgi:hypothetical protein
MSARGNSTFKPRTSPCSEIARSIASARYSGGVIHRQAIAGGPQRLPVDAARRDANAHVAAAGHQPTHERIDRVRTGKDNPIEAVHLRAGLVEGAEVLGRQNTDHRRFDRFRPHRFESLHQFRRLIARPRHENAFAEQRPRIEPA